MKDQAEWRNIYIWSENNLKTRHFALNIFESLSLKRDGGKEKKQKPTIKSLLAQTTFPIGFPARLESE